MKEFIKKGGPTSFPKDVSAWQMSLIFDSNIIIYSTLPVYSALQKFAIDHDEYCSRIPYLEVLRHHKLTPLDKKYFEVLFDTFQVLEIDEARNYTCHITASKNKYRFL